MKQMKVKMWVNGRTVAVRRMKKTKPSSEVCKAVLPIMTWPEGILECIELNYYPELNEIILMVRSSA